MEQILKMRFFNKLTNEEIESYLMKNDIVFIPIGTVEEHKNWPLDAETTFAEAIAVSMAEKANGLVMGPLPFFYPGVGKDGKGTVQIGVRAGIKYLKELSYSLLNQGFRRQVYVTTNKDGFTTAGGVVIDFFDETKCPITYMNLENLIQVANENNKSLKVKLMDETLDKMRYGAYGILGREKELQEVNEMADEKWQENIMQGRLLIESITAALNLDRYFESMKNLDVRVNTVIKAHYAGNLPKNKFSEWN